MGNAASTASHGRALNAEQNLASILALIFGSPGVGKRNVWLQAVNGQKFISHYDSKVAARMSLRSTSDVLQGHTVESVFAISEHGTSTILTARFKQAKVFVLVYDVCDRESFLDVTSQRTSLDVLSAIQAHRRSFPSRKQKVFLIGTKIDAYTAKDMWHEESLRQELDNWESDANSKLSSRSIELLKQRLRTTGRERQVTTAEGRALAMEHDMLFFEASAYSGEGVSMIREAMESALKRESASPLNSAASVGSRFSDSSTHSSSSQ